MKRWVRQPKPGAVYRVRIMDGRERPWREYTDPDVAERVAAELRALGHTVERREFRQWAQIDLNLLNG